MMLTKTAAFAFAVLLASALGIPALASSLTDAEISTMLRERIDQDSMGVGIVVGIVDGHGSKVFSYGKMKAGGDANVNGDTLFEIGSITKVFTTLLLQDMVEHGEVKLDDSIGKFLPAHVKTPSYNRREITLVDLATHTSGLPRLPASMCTFSYILWHHNDPYAGFGKKDLYRFLSSYKLKEQIGTKFEYSNLGMELLGHVLSLKGGTNYESLVLLRICEPLKMNSTCVTLSPELKSRLATGHDEGGKPVHNWSSPLPGDGGINSSVNDLLKLLSAEMGLAPSSLSETMSKTQVSRHETDTSGQQVGLGWAIQPKSSLVWHNGGTGGYRSWIGFNKKTRSGMVVLSNSEIAVDDLGAMLAGHMNADAFSRRGVAREVLGDFSGALSDYDKFIELKPGDSDYERLYRQTLLWRLGRPPEDLSKSLTRCRLGWTKTVARFLAGELDEKSFLQAAKKRDGETVSEQKALAFYYIGVMRLSKGDTGGARDWFQKCLAAGLKGDDEYQFAVAELARLNAASPP